MASIFVRTLIVYILLSVSLKIMGKRQIGELDISELVSTLLISEIAALPIDDPDLPLMNAIIPIMFILSLEIIISYSKTKYNKLKKYVEGDPVFLIYKSKISQKALRESRITINEFLAEMRSQGTNNIEDIEYALLEQNGKISILKKTNTKAAHPILIDGCVNAAELKGLGLDKEYVTAEVKKRKLCIQDVFLMTLDDDGKINIIIKEEK